MNNLNRVISEYKPYKITKMGNSTIILSTSGSYVLKKENKELYTLFNYLNNRGFNNFPSLIKNFRDKENLFEYVEDEKIFDEQKLIDLADTIASLHNKTVYFKNVSKDNYKEIYEQIDNNIKYLSSYFQSIFLKAISIEYQSPSDYLFCRNYYKISSSLKFCKKQLDSFYEIINDKDTARVAVVHNNIKMDHFIENKDGKYLISWDNYKIDSPIFDIINLYHNEYLNYDFSAFLKEYLECFPLLEEEKKLLFIMISLPLKVIPTEGEINKTVNMHNMITYLYKTEKLIKPYYENNEDEN